MAAYRFLHWLPPDDGTGKYSFTKKALGVVICLELFMAELMPLPVASVKSRYVLPFWYRLTLVVLCLQSWINYVAEQGLSVSGSQQQTRSRFTTGARWRQDQSIAAWPALSSSTRQCGRCHVESWTHTCYTKPSQCRSSSLLFEKLQNMCDKNCGKQEHNLHSTWAN